MLLPRASSLGHSSPTSCHSEHWHSAIFTFNTVCPFVKWSLFTYMTPKDTISMCSHFFSQTWVFFKRLLNRWVLKFSFMPSLQPKIFINLQFSLWKVKELNASISVICDLSAPLGYDCIIYCHVQPPQWCYHNSVTGFRFIVNTHMHVCSVSQSSLTLSGSMDSSTPDSSVHGIL